MANADKLRTEIAEITEKIREINSKENPTAEDYASVKPLALFSFPVNLLHTRSARIRGIADVKGRKIGAAGSAARGKPRRSMPPPPGLPAAANPSPKPRHRGRVVNVPPFPTDETGYPVCRGGRHAEGARGLGKAFP